MKTAPEQHCHFDRSIALREANSMRSGETLCFEVSPRLTNFASEMR